MAVVVEAAEALYSYPQLWRILTKSCYFLSTGLAGGSVLFHTFVLRPALRREPAVEGDRAVLKQRSAWLLAFAGIALLLAAYPQFAGKVTRSTPGLTFADGLHAVRGAGLSADPGGQRGVDARPAALAAHSSGSTSLVPSC